MTYEALGEDPPDEPTRAYGKKLLHAVQGMVKIIHRHATLAPEDFRAALEQAKAQMIRIALEEAPGQLDEDGKEQKREAQSRANRFRKHGQAYFEFITTPGMDPTNNVAEQAVRFIVIDRQVTQGTQSAKGQRANERLWTVIAT
jgi:transposase